MRVARDSLFQSDYILAYVGGEQSPAPGGVTVTSTAAGTAQVCRSSVQLQMHTEEHCIALFCCGHWDTAARRFILVTRV